MLEAVAEVVVVVAGYIAYMLAWLGTPCCLGVVNLGMLNATHDTKLQRLLVTLHAMDEATLREVERATQCVAYIVREGCDARHLVCVALEGEFALVVEGRTCCPTLAIEQDVGI